MLRFHYPHLFLATLLALVLTTACSNPSNTPQNPPSAPSQQELDRLEIELDSNMDQLTQIRNSIEIQGRQLSPEEIALTKRIALFENQYNKWKTEWESETLSPARHKELTGRLRKLLQSSEQVLQSAE